MRSVFFGAIEFWALGVFTHLWKGEIRIQVKCNWNWCEIVQVTFLGYSQLSTIKSKEDRKVTFWPLDGSVTLSLRSRSKIFGVSTFLTMGYLLVKFQVPTKKKWLLGKIIIIVPKTKASPKVLGEANNNISFIQSLTWNFVYMNSIIFPDIHSYKRQHTSVYSYSTTTQTYIQAYR